jgi:uncharacterized membrane protein YcaP (DUF421 family)
MDLHELLMTALRALAVYLLLLVLLRVMGKRTIGNFTAFDLLVALMLGEVVDEMIYGDVSFAQGVTAILVVCLLQYGNSWLSYWDHGFDRVLEGVPTPVVEGGRLVQEGLRKERMNEKEVMAELRLHGIDDLREVKLAMVESDGEVSVIRHRWAEPVEKGDVLADAAGEKRQDTGGREDPPSGQQTTSRRNRES